MQKLDNEQEYLHALPSADMYERSFMHRETVTHSAMAIQTEFLVTASTDGHIKFWKKRPQGIEFAKHFRAHVGPVKGNNLPALAQLAGDPCIETVLDLHAAASLMTRRASDC